MGLTMLPEDVMINVYKSRFVPEEYIGAENIRLSVYKSLASASSEADLDRIVFSLINRFGNIPGPLYNVINEYRLRLLAARVGICSILLKGCGVQFCIEAQNREGFGDTLINYINAYWGRLGVDYHIIPSTNNLLGFCVHLSAAEDKYSNISDFLDKFKSVEKLNN
mgnify:CR=1 FL=1